MVSESRHTFAPQVSDREIVNSRVFGVPRERIFRAWTDPAELAAWWGPRGFTNTFQEFNPVPGGAWRYVMHGPNGANYPNRSMFVEILPERIVIDHVSDPTFQIEATFVEQAGQTKVTFRMRFETAAECDKVKGFAPAANEENFDRLAALLASDSE